MSSETTTTEQTPKQNSICNKKLEGFDRFKINKNINTFNENELIKLDDDDYLINSIIQLYGLIDINNNNQPYNELKNLLNDPAFNNIDKKQFFKHLVRYVKTEENMECFPNEFFSNLDYDYNSIKPFYDKFSTIRTKYEKSKFNDMKNAAKNVFNKMNIFSKKPPVNEVPNTEGNNITPAQPQKKRFGFFGGKIKCKKSKKTKKSKKSRKTKRNKSHKK